MKRERYMLAGFILSLLLLFIALTAKDYVFYTYPLAVSDYQYKQTDEKPVQAQTPFWFAFGSGAEFFYGHTEVVSKDAVRLFASTEQGAVAITEKDLQPIRSDLTGYFIAVLPERKEDLNGDGMGEMVSDPKRKCLLSAGGGCMDPGLSGQDENIQTSSNPRGTVPDHAGISEKESDQCR